MYDIFIIIIDPATKKSLIPKISARQICIDLIKSRGVLGLYKGLTVTILRDVPFCVVYFSLFAKLDAYGPRKSNGSGEHTSQLIN